MEKPASEHSDTATASTDKSLEDSNDLPDPEVLAQEIVDDMQTALDQFSAVVEGLKE
jgi:type I restriction enzyme M protein